MQYEHSRATSFLLVSASLVVIMAGLQAAQTLIVPLLLAAFIACLCFPPMRACMRYGLPSGLSVFLVMMFLLLLLFLLVVFVGASVSDFSHHLPEYQETVRAQFQMLFLSLVDLGLPVQMDDAMAHFDPSLAMGMAGSLLKGLGNVLSDAFFIVLMVVFMLFEGLSLSHKWRLMGAHAPSMTSLQAFLDNVYQYISIKTTMSLLTGCLLTLGLWLLGVDYPVLWGLLSFLFNFVPNIGSFIAAIPALMLALVQLGLDGMFYTLLLYIFVNILVGTVLEPKYMGKGLGLSTLVVFVSLIFWGWMLGLVGMLLSVPLTMILKLALEANEKTQWLAILIGSDVAEKQEKSLF